MALWRRGTTGIVLDDSGAILCEDCPCGGITTGACDKCLGGIALCWELVVAGISHSGCGPGHNGTFICEQGAVGAFNPCQVESGLTSYQFPSGFVCGTFQSKWSFNYQSISDQWRLAKNSGNGSIRYVIDGLANFDCLGPNTFSQDFMPPNWSGPATLTVEPIACP